MGRFKELVQTAQERPGVQIVAVCSTRISCQQNMQGFLTLGFAGAETVDLKHLIVKFINGSRIRFLYYDHPTMIRGWEADVIWVDTHGMKPELREPILTACKNRLRGENKPRLFAADDGDFEEFETLTVGVKHLIPPVILENNAILPPISDEQRERFLHGRWDIEA